MTLLLVGIMRPREPGRKPIHRVAYPCDLDENYNVGSWERESGLGRWENRADILHETREQMQKVGLLLL